MITKTKILKDLNVFLTDLQTKRMRYRLLLSYCILCTIPLFSQGWRPVGARSAALANTSVCLDDVWAYHNNPGATAGIKQFSVGLYYEARFLAKELQTQGLAMAIPLKKGVISVGGQFYGYEQYRHTRAGVGYALSLSEKISAGVQMNLQQLRFGGSYGSSTNATVEAGILATISEKWKLGMSVLNIGRQRVSPLEEDRFTSVVRIGSSYQPSKKVSILMEVEKQVVHPVSFRGALEYFPIENLVIRFGAQSGPTELAFGVGYKKNGFQIDLGSKYHTILGWTPNMGFTYQPSHAKK